MCPCKCMMDANANMFKSVKYVKKEKKNSGKLKRWWTFLREKIMHTRQPEWWDVILVQEKHVTIINENEKRWEKISKPFL